MSRALTEIAQERLRPHLQPGDIAVDATAGNGHDTLFLASTVGPTGRVFAIDLQAAAIAATNARLAAAGVHQVSTILGNHAEWDRLLPGELRGHIAVVMFNLGYLPHGDHQFTTHSESTVVALSVAAAWLRSGGCLSVLVYPGHPAGWLEAEAVRCWVKQLPGDRWTCEEILAHHPSDTTPFLFLIQKRAAK